MTSVPECLSNNALLSSEVRRVLAACSKKQVELDKVKKDLARQQSELDNRKLEIKTKQSKIDKQQQQIHKFEKWFLQVSLIERIERIGEATKHGPKSDTDSDGDTEEDSEGGSEVEGETDDEEEYETDDEAEYDNDDEAHCNDYKWDEPASSFQQARGDPKLSTHGPVGPDHVWPASCWGIGKEQSAHTTKEKNQSPNNAVPTKTKSPIKTESSGKDMSTQKSTYDGWNDPTVASRIPWADPTAAPKPQQKDHKVQDTRNPSNLDRAWYAPEAPKASKSPKAPKAPKAPKVGTESWYYEAMKTAMEQRSVRHSTNKPNDIGEGDMSNGNTGYHWNDKSTDDELPNDKSTNDKVTNVNEGKPSTEAAYHWSLSGHSSDADNLTTWGVPVVTPDSSKSGSGTCSHASKGTSKEVKGEASFREEEYKDWQDVKVEASLPEEEYKDWHKYDDPRYKGWTTAEIDEYDAKVEPW